MSRVLSLTWWRSIAGALLRSGLAALVPFIPAIVANPAGTWQIAALTVALVVVLAAASALGSLPDLSGSASWWEVAIQRSLRQFGQMVGAAAASAAILTDVNWRAVLIAAAGSALSTLVIAALASLPTAPTVTADALQDVIVHGTVTVSATSAGISGVTITGVPDPAKHRA